MTNFLSPEVPLLENRWTTEHRDQFVYYVEKRRKSNKALSINKTPTFVNYPSSIQNNASNTTSTMNYEQSMQHTRSNPNLNAPSHYLVNNPENTYAKPTKVEEHRPLQYEETSTMTQHRKTVMENNTVPLTKENEASEEVQRPFSSPNSRKSQPPFHNYGWNNTKPIIDEHYLKTWNINPLHNAHVYDNVISRREKSHQYDGWKNVAKENQGIEKNESLDESMQKSQFTEVLKSSFEKRPKTANSKPKKQKTKQRQEEDNSSFIHESQKPQANLYSSWNSYNGFENTKPEVKNESRSDSYNPMKYSSNFLNSAASADSCTNTEPIEEMEYDEMQYINFEPYNREEFDPKHYKHLPPRFMSYIVPAGRQTISSEDIRECFKTHR